mmetsp:Transcript_13315/g.28246  ORF Transcript_13315/g.28246 Transcript_13315/m.28246 type:complete len:322 (-) Transcript_13315:789-1754(-)
MHRQCRLRRGVVCYVISLLYCLGVLFQKYLSSSFPDTSTKLRSISATLHSQESKLADGCYHVFLDVGSNIGMHVRFLFQPTLYPDAKVARHFFRTHIGPEESRINSDICVFSFEPNPSHLERHEEMRRAYDSMGWRYHPIHGGVSDKDGNLTFYHIGDETGFTMLNSSCRKRCDPEYVPIYHLSSWIEREVRGREIPEPSGQYPYGPRVVMKMDIEMMEWIVFPDLLYSGALCKDIHAVMGEFHLRSHWFFYPITFDDYKGTGKNFTVQSWEEGVKLRDEWIGIMEKNPNCTTQLSMQDDESHRNDGMPWPRQQMNMSLEI